ncbi:MAG: hypothetical protein JWM24_259 [Solirubrobacterales bacterium]|nr:hypothetical protein [Solirubrobacterales bacterium]
MGNREGGVGRVKIEIKQDKVTPVAIVKGS